MSILVMLLVWTLLNTDLIVFVEKVAYLIYFMQNGPNHVGYGIVAIYRDSFLPWK